MRSKFAKPHGMRGYVCPMCGLRIAWRGEAVGKFLERVDAHCSLNCFVTDARAFEVILGEELNEWHLRK